MVKLDHQSQCTLFTGRDLSIGHTYSQLNIPSQNTVFSLSLKPQGCNDHTLTHSHRHAHSLQLHTHTHTHTHTDILSLSLIHTLNSFCH